MAKRLHQTLADYVVIAISPALIMALVGSLVFFLLEVFYQGQFVGRLHWVMACFVFAAVLIGRISIEEGYERAIVFGIALAIPVGIASSRFIEIQGNWVDQFGWLINWGLIGLIWWCAHRLTWDCTVIDDAEDASGEGLLQIAGLEKRPAPAEAEPPSGPVTASGDKKRRKKARADLPLTTRAAARLEGTTSREVPAGWWQRYVEKSRRPHAPGVWVVYFSLAALPLFGIGQWFIPAADVAGRRYAFWLLAIYVAAGLGLLLTTSFLGLRRYLRQRRIEMPTLMANLWLTTGAMVIALLLVLAALLPRPDAEYAISELPFSVGSPDSSSSHHAPVRSEGADDDDPNAAPQSDPTGRQDARGSGGSERTDAPPQGEGGHESDDRGGSRQSSDAKAQASGEKQQGDESKGNSSGSAQDKDGRQSSSSDPRRDASDARRRAGSERSREKPGTPPRSDATEGGKPESVSAKQPRTGESNEQPQASSERSPPRERQRAEQDQEQQRSDDANNEKPAERTRLLPGETELPPPPVDELESAGKLVAWLKEYPKWIFYGVVIVVVAVGLWRTRAELLAALREILTAFGDLFAGLWGTKRRVPAAADDPRIELELPPTPFSSYADPFASGADQQATLEELVRYSFEAFEAWSREHGCPRHPDQTPHELARNVARHNPAIAAEARAIAELYSRAAFDRGELPAKEGREQLRLLWRRMAAGAPRVVGRF